MSVDYLIILLWKAGMAVIVSSRSVVLRSFSLTFCIEALIIFVTQSSVDPISNTESAG